MRHRESIIKSTVFHINMDVWRFVCLFILISSAHFVYVNMCNVYA